MSEMKAEIKPDYEAEAWTLGVRIDDLLVHDIEGLVKGEADVLATRINDYEKVKGERDEAVEILKRVKRDSIGLPDFCSVCMDDIDAFLAKIDKEADDAKS